MLFSLILINTLLILAGIVLLSFAYAGLRAAPWVPAFKADIKRILDAAGTVQGKEVYELGSGDGRIVEAFAKAGAHSTGFELAIGMYAWSSLRFWWTKTKNIKIVFRDFWNISFDKADLVYLYLMPHIYPRLEAKLKKELRPGSSVVVYAFPFQTWEPTQTYKETDRPNIYVYTV